MKRIAIVLVAMFVIAACGSSNSSNATPKKAVASAAACKKVFEDYQMDSITWDGSGSIKKFVTRFYTQAVLKCPDHATWDRVAERVAPDQVTDWSDPVARRDVWVGMCNELAGLKTPKPACS